MREGKKNDYQDGKLRWDLLPLEEIEDIVKLYTAQQLQLGMQQQCFTQINTEKERTMTLNDQELAKIVRDRIPVTIDNKQFIVESNPIGSCDGCYYLDKNCPTLARRYCCSNGGNILRLKKQNNK